MSFIQRFLLGNRVEDDLQVGLFLKNDGTVWLRNPDGSETQVSGGGGGSSVYQQPDDPGAVGAGAFWVNTTGIGGTNDLPLSVRDPSDAFWSPVGLAHYDDTGQLRGFVTMSDSAVVVEKKDSDGNTMAYILLADDRVYFSSARLPIWISAAGLGGTEWGLSSPSGSEKFEGITEPDDSEVTPTQSTAGKIIWLDVADGNSRFKVTTDSGGTVTPGMIAGLVEDGTSFLNVTKPSVAAATGPAILAALVALGLVIDDT